MAGEQPKFELDYRRGAIAFVSGFLLFWATGWEFLTVSAFFNPDGMVTINDRPTPVREAMPMLLFFALIGVGPAVLSVRYLLSFIFERISIYGGLMRYTDWRGRTEVYRMEDLRSVEQRPGGRGGPGSLVFDFLSGRVVIAAASVKGRPGDRFGEFTELKAYAEACLAANRERAASLEADLDRTFDIRWNPSRAVWFLPSMYVWLALAAVGVPISFAVGGVSPQSVLGAILVLAVPLALVVLLRRRVESSEQRVQVISRMVQHTRADGHARVYPLDDLVKVQDNTLVFTDGEIELQPSVARVNVLIGGFATNQETLDLLAFSRKLAEDRKPSELPKPKTKRSPLFDPIE